MACIRFFSSTLVLLCLLLHTACLPEIPATNPYDPEVPEEQQQKSSLSGLVLGRTVTGDLFPLAGATIEIEGKSNPASNPYVSDADGGFNFGSLIPGRYRIVIEHSTHYSKDSEYFIEPGEERYLRVILEPQPEEVSITTGRLSGIAHKSGELALPEAQQDHSGILVEIAGTGVRTVTNPGGAFDFFLDAGTYTLVLTAPNYNLTERHDVDVVAEQEVTIDTIVMNANPGVVSGVVQLEGATDHSNATITIVGTSLTTTSDATGAFQLTDVPAGTHALQVSKPSFETLTINGISVSGGNETTVVPFTLSLARGNLHGSIIMEDSSAPTGVLIEVQGTLHSTVTNSAGDFYITGIALGNYSVVATKPNYQSASQPDVSITANATTEVGALTLSSNPGSISGVLRYEGQTSHSGITISLLQTAWAGVTSSDGAFTLNGVSAGTYTLQASAAGYDVLYFPGVVVGAAAETTVPPLELPLSRGGVEGVVNLSDSDDNSGVTIELQGTSFTAATNSAGEFSFQGVPINTYTLRALKNGYVPKEISVIITSNTNLVLSESIELPKKQGDFEINGGNLYTNALNISLSLTSNNAVSMRINEDSTFADATLGDTEFKSFDPSTSFTLSSGDGEKIVYVQFKDSDGIESSTFQSSILLDTTPPESLTVVLDGGAPYSNNPNAIVTASVVGSDSGSGIDGVRYSTTDDSNSIDTNSSFQELTSSWPFTFSAAVGNDGPQTIYVHAKDRAGNISAAAAQAQITFDRVPPSINGGAFSVACELGGASTYCASPLVALSIQGTGDPQLMAFSNEAGFPTVLWEPYTQSRSWFVAPGDCQTADCKTIYLKLKDAAGNESEAFQTSMTLDTQAPVAGGIQLADSASVTNAADNRVALTITGGESDYLVVIDGDIDASDKGTYWYNASRDGMNGITKLPTQITLVNNNAINGVSAQFIDAAGNIGPVFSDFIVHDTEPPLLLGASFLAGDFSNLTQHYVQLDAIDADEVRVSANPGNLAPGQSENWQPHQSNQMVIQLASPGGTTPVSRTISLEVRDAAGNISAQAVSASIILDTAAPAISMEINGGNVATSQRAVNLVFGNLSVEPSHAPLVGIQIYNTPEDQACQAPQNPAWSSVQGSSTWLLEDLANASTPETKRVCVTMIDAAGNTVTNTDTIILDQASATGTLVIDPDNNGAGAAKTGSLFVELQLNTSESVYWAVGNESMDCSSASYSSNYTTSSTIGSHQLPDTNGIRTVLACVRDLAGNVSQFSDTIELDRLPPPGTFVIEGGADYTNNPSIDATSVTVSFTLSDDDASGTLSYVLAQGEMTYCPSVTSGIWTTLDTSNPSVSLTLNGADGIKTVSSCFMDDVGNRSLLPSERITVDHGAPTVPTNPTLTVRAGYSNTTVGGLETINDPLPVFYWDESTDTHSSQVNYRLEIASVDNFGGNASPEYAFTNITQARLAMPNELGDGQWFWRVVAVDSAGNEAAGSSSTFEVKYTGPLQPTLNNVPQFANDSFMVNWSTQDAIDTAEYEIILIRGGAIILDQTQTANSFTFLADTHLADSSGQEYTIKVYPIDHVGNKGYPAVATFMYDTTAPSNYSVRIVTGLSYEETPDTNFPSCTGNAVWLADGYCDAANNNSNCGWDAGDCCASTCVSSTYNCGAAGYSCNNPGACDYNGGTCGGSGTPQVDRFTNSVSITLSLAAVDSVDMQITTDDCTLAGSGTSGTSGDCETSLDRESWIPFTTSRTVLLPSGDCAPGDLNCKPVHVRFRDRSGNLSTIVADSITLDTIAPSAPKITTAPQVITDNGGQDFELDIFAPVSDSNFYRYEILGATESGWTADSEAIGTTAFQYTLRIDPSDEDGVPNLLQLRAVDKAGNASPVASVIITTDTNAPDPVELNELWVRNSSESGRVFWKPSPSTDVAGYRIYYGSSAATLNGEYGLEGGSPFSVGVQTSTVISGLINGSQTFVTIRPVDHAGNEGDAPASHSPVVLNPAKTSLDKISSLDLGLYPNKQIIIGDTLLVVGTSSSHWSFNSNTVTKLAIVDISDLESAINGGVVNESPSQPTILNTYEFNDGYTNLNMYDGKGSSLEVDGGIGVMVGGSQFRVLNLNDPRNPQVLSEIEFSSLRLTGVSVQGRLALVTAVSSTDDYDGYVVAVDLSSLFDGDAATQPSITSVLGELNENHSYRLGGVTISRDMAYVHQTASPAYVHTHSIGPWLKGESLSGSALDDVYLGYEPGIASSGAYNLHASGNYLYVAASEGFQILDLTNSWGGNLLLPDTGDTVNDVLIEAGIPSRGQFVIEGTQAFVPDNNAPAVRALDLLNAHTGTIETTGFVPVSEAYESVVTKNGYLFAVTSSGDLDVYETGVPRSFVEVARGNNSGFQHKVDGGFLYTDSGRIVDLQAGSNLAADGIFGVSFGQAIYEEGAVYAKGPTLRVANLDNLTDRNASTTASQNDASTFYDITLANDFFATDVDAHGNLLLVTGRRPDGTYIEVFNAIDLRDRDATTTLDLSDSQASYKVSDGSYDCLSGCGLHTFFAARLELYRGRGIITISNPTTTSSALETSAGVHVIDLRPLLDFDDTTTMTADHHQGWAVLTTNADGGIDSVIRGSSLYVTTASGSGVGYLKVIDLSNALDSDLATKIGTVDIQASITIGYNAILTLSGHYAIVIGQGSSGITALDLTDLNNPIIMATYPYSRPGTAYQKAWGPGGANRYIPFTPQVSIHGDRVYITRSGDALILGLD